MENEKTGFFEEKPRVNSSTRLESFILLLFFMAFNMFWIYAGNDLSENILILDLLMLVGVFAPKYLHKAVEMKFGKMDKVK